MTPPVALPVALPDYAAAAAERLEAQARAYFDGGAADELTLAANLRAWQQIGLQSRVLRPMAGAHTRVELLGRTLAHPVLLAPVAYQRLAHPEGELATAQAAAAARDEAAAAAAAIIFFICTPFCPSGRTSLPSAQKILFLAIAII